MQSVLICDVIMFRGVAARAGRARIVARVERAVSPPRLGGVWGVDVCTSTLVPYGFVARVFDRMSRPDLRIDRLQSFETLHVLMNYMIEGYTD